MDIKHWYIGKKYFSEPLDYHKKKNLKSTWNKFIRQKHYKYINKSLQVLNTWHFWRNSWPSPWPSTHLPENQPFLPFSDFCSDEIIWTNHTSWEYAFRDVSTTPSPAMTTHTGRRTLKCRKSYFPVSSSYKTGTMSSYIKVKMWVFIFLPSSALLSHGSQQFWLQ